MTYTHLTSNELVMIEAYFHEHISVTLIATRLKRSRQTIYNVVNALRQGVTTSEYITQYKRNKQRCGRRRCQLPLEQTNYIKQKTAEG